MGEATKNRSAVFRRESSKEGFPQIDVSTLYELFSKSAERFADLPALGSRPIKVRQGRRRGDRSEARARPHRCAQRSAKRCKA